jgi:hypothetical protein
MKKIISFIIFFIGFLTTLSVATQTDAASTSVNIPPYGTVYVTANHYGPDGQWDAQGTNNLMSNPAGAALGAINSGGSYSYQYSCGNTDVVSASCAGGNTCYRNNIYNVTGSCSLTLATECSNGCKGKTCNPETPGGPARPVIQAATSDVCGGKVRIYWNPSAGATSYSVYRATSQDGTFTEVANSPTTLTDFTDTPGTGTYYYKVKAINSAGSSLSTSVSAKGSAYCPPLPPTTSISAAPSDQCGGKVTVSWSPVPGAGGYNVYRWNSNDTATYNSYLSSYRTYGRSENNFPYYFKYYGYNQGLITPTGTASTSMTDIPKGKGPYYYSVAAYPSAGTNKSDMGRFASAVQVLKASDACPAPAIPSNFKAQTAASCGGKIYLTWDKSTGAESYIISRSKSENGNYNVIANLSGSVSNYTDTSGNGMFFYKIAANTGGSTSLPSSATGATASAACEEGEDETPQPVSLTIKAVPTYVQKGKTCNIEWTVLNSTACKITGTNGDTREFNPIEEINFTSSPLQSRTIYTVSCTNDAGTISKIAACNINPSTTEN